MVRSNARQVNSGSASARSAPQAVSSSSSAAVAQKAEVATSSTARTSLSSKAAGKLEAVEGVVEVPKPSLAGVKGKGPKLPGVAKPKSTGPRPKVKANMTDQAKNNRASRQPFREADSSVRTIHKGELENFQAMSTAAKGARAELESVKAMEKSGYRCLNCKGVSDQGIDHIFYNNVMSDGVNTLDIIVVEVKYHPKGYIKLGYTQECQQLSSKWLRLQQKTMKKNYRRNPIKYKHLEEPIRLLSEHADSVRFKAAILNQNGIMNWYDYGRYQ